MTRTLDISRTTSSDPLLQPFQLKHLTLKNRIMITAHEPAYAEDGLPKERYIAYQVERAKGGIALTMTAGSASVSRDSPPAFNNVLAYKDEVVPWLRRLTEAVHEQDCAVMIQLSHLGRRTGWDKGDWLPSLSTTREREPAHLYAPKLIEDWDRARIIDDYVSAAQRMVEGGMDGIELEAYGHLLDQSWSPLTNDLDAPYGGSLDNRLRFTFEILHAVRKAIGPKMILGVRFVADEVEEGGLTEQDGLEIARRFEQSEQVDFLNIIRGRIHTDAALTDVIPVQGMRSSPHLNFAGRVKSATNLPTFHAAKIADVATARHAVTDGLLDMVGMTRAHIADPHIVRKIMAKKEDNIRPCVGATYCLDRIYQGAEALCIHNPSTGREREQPHDIKPSRTQQRIMIIGAGPAGLEAARVAGERGHQVNVYEAASDPGGQIRLTTQSPRKRDMSGIIDWRLAECERLGVRFHFNHWVEADDVLAIRPDIVIVATGGMPDPGAWVGSDLAVSGWDILSGDAKPGSRVLLYDAVGDHTGQQAANIIAQSGARLEIMTPDRSLARDVMGMNFVPYMRALEGKNVRFTLTRRLLEIRREGNALQAFIGTDYSDHIYKDRYDQIVVNAGITPLNDLYVALKPQSSNLGAVDYDALIAGGAQTLGPNPDGRFKLFRIGDAVSARNTHAAIYDALRLVRTF